MAEYTRRERANQESKNPPAYVTGSSTAGVVGAIRTVSSPEFPLASSEPVGYDNRGMIPASPARYRPMSLTPGTYTYTGRPGSVSLTTVDRIEQKINEAIRASKMLRPFGDAGLSLADNAEREVEFLRGLMNGLRSPDGGYIQDQLSATERAYYSGETRESAEQAAEDYSSPTPGRYPNWGGLRGPRTYDEQVDWLAKNAPGALAALAEAGMDPADVANATEIFYAKRTSQTVAELLTMGLQYKALQIVAILPPKQRILVAALLDEEQKQHEAAARETAERLGAAGIRGGTPDAIRGTNAGAPASPAGPVEGQEDNMLSQVFNNALNILLWPVEQVTHVARANNVAARSLADPTLLSPSGTSFQQIIQEQGIGGIPEFLGALWDSTSANSLNAVRIAELRVEYGDFATDLAVEFYLASQSDDPNAMQWFLSKYSQDGEAQALINQMINGTETGGDATAASLFVEVAATDQGNWGNLFAQSFGLEPDPQNDLQNLAFSSVRDVANVSSWFVFDPLIWGGKIVKGIQAARWSMGAERFGGNLGAAIRGDAAVRRWFDNFGTALKSADEARAGTSVKDMNQSQRRLNKLTGPEAPYGSTELAQIGRKYKLYTADEWARLFDDLETTKRWTEGKAAGLPIIDPKKGGLEYLSQFTPAARTEARLARLASKPDPRRAWDAAAAETAIVAGQAAKRTMMMPHMSRTSEAFSVLSNKVLNTVAPSRGAAGAARVEKLLDDVVPDWRTMDPEQRTEALFTSLGREETADMIGYRLSDFVAMDSGGQRTAVAAFLDRFVTAYGTRERTTAVLGTNRKGYRRRGWYFGKGDLTFSEALSAKLDRWRRLGTRLPDQRFGMVTADASDADKMYQMLRWAGIDHAAASLFKDSWIGASENARMVAYTGLVRSTLRATGMHLISPDDEARILEKVTGIASRELHAPISIARHGGVMRDIEKTANRIHAEQKAAARAAKEAGEEVPEVESVSTIARVLEREARQEGGALRKYVSPSMHAGGELSSAKYLGQTSPVVWMPNFAALDRYTARKSMLNMFLFNNNVSALIVEAWVLGTLGGPRFQLRNGVEDVGLYALTGGGVGNFYRGRKTSQAVREATARDDTRLRAAMADRKKAASEYDQAQKQFERGEIQARDLRVAEDKLRRASNVLQHYEKRSKIGLNQKLGFVRTSAIRLSDRVSRDAVSGNLNDSMVARFAQWLVPTTSRKERQAAALAGREATANLQVKSILRNKLVMVNDPELRGIPLRLRRGAEISELSPRQQHAMTATDRLLKSEYGTVYRDNAAETSRHLSDGTFPSVDDLGDMTIIGGQIYRRIYFDTGYTTQRIGSSRLNEAQARAMMQHLQLIVDNGRLGQAALTRLPSFWRAYNASNASDTTKMREIAEEILAEAKRGPEWALYSSRFRAIATDGELKFVEDLLTDMAATFTTRRGKWNEKLWSTLRTEDDKGRAYFRIMDDKADDAVVHDIDFMNGVFDAPESILVFRGEPALLPATRQGYERFTSGAWEIMGRSLARMTREPLWYGNYLDAAYKLEPLRKKYATIFGEAQADRMITDLAAERAYSLTMAYVDNPAVRTQLAWHVRNIARYYRAIEDFGRRLIRVGKNDPMAYWKATLAWQASQDFGFVHNDQYGNSYFMYPFTRTALTHLAAIGVDTKFAQVPMAFGGNVQWISPSADPAQWIPTLSSPWAAVTLQPLIRSLPTFTEFLNFPEWAQVSPDVAKEVEANLFGDISAETRVESKYEGLGGEFASSLYSTLPPNFKKLITLGGLAYGSQPPGTFGNKIAMKTFMLMTAAGLTPTAEEWTSPRVKEDFLNQLDRHAVNVSFLSLLFGLVAPSSPQVMDDNLTFAAREAAWESIVPALRQAIKASTDNGQTWEEAYISWTASNPNSGAFLVTRRKGAEYGYIEPLSGNVDYLRKNQDLWETVPVGVTVFAPRTGEESYKSYKAMQMFNAGQFKDLEDYGTELVNLYGYQQYILSKAEFEADTAGMSKYMPDGSVNPQFSAAEEAWQTARRSLTTQFRGLSERLNIREKKNRDNWVEEANQIVTAGQVLADRGNDKAQETLSLIQSYLDASADMDRLRTDYSAVYNEESGDIKGAWETAVTSWLSGLKAVDQESARTIVYTLTKALSEGWTVEGFGV